MMMEFIETCFIGPVFPATVLMVLIMVYGLMVVAGTVDINLFDVDFDTDLDVDGAATSVGFVALRFLNIGNVPIMIWVTFFGLLWWIASMLLWSFFDQGGDSQGVWSATQLALRNAAIAVVGTKFATDPMRKFFDQTDKFKPQDLVGKQCEVTTAEVTKDSGQAKFKTDAAPLLIDVRTDDGPFSKGDVATIIDFDPVTNIHFITTDTEVSK